MIHSLTDFDVPQSSSASQEYGTPKSVSELCRLYMVMQVRWKVYNPYYIDPVIDKEELLQPLEENDERKFKPIKAAGTHENIAFYYDPLVIKFTNMMMRKGQKQLARSLVEKTFENIKRIQIEKYHKSPDEEKPNIELNPVKIFYQAVDNCKPVLILTKVRKGGVSYQVPIACPDNYSRFKSMKWLIESCRDKDRIMPFEKKLSRELIDAHENEGRAVRKKQELHKLCDANKAFSHLRL